MNSKAKKGWTKANLTVAAAVVSLLILGVVLETAVRVRQCILYASVVDPGFRQLRSKTSAVYV